MNKKKICVIYNYAQHYRTNIFTLMDITFDCDWYFGDSMGDVKKMDYSLLKGRVTEVHNKALLGNWDYQIGVPSLIFHKEYDAYIVLSDTRSVSTWLFSILAKFFPEKNVYFWSHGWYGKESGVEKVIKKILYRLPNGGTFLYGNYARELMIKEGFNPDKLFTIHNSLAYDQQLAVRKEMKQTSVFSDHFENRNPNLFFVGRLTPVKKLDQILQSMVISKQNGHEYNLTFIGGGEKTKELKQLTNDLGLQSNVWFYGPCYDEKELSNLIYNADLCVAPGNIGLTAMHSLVFGTPAITHNCYMWQMPEFEAIQEGKTGTFFEMDNINDLSAKIDAWFMTNGNKRDEIRLNCFKEIDEQWNPYFQIEVLKKQLQHD
ncbi:MAG: glycosyltransferase [Bacteroides thetaiotaomicron]|nr:glycosyltransferase [Bacteroides thetaiotaomicron]